MSILEAFMALLKEAGAEFSMVQKDVRTITYDALLEGSMPFCVELDNLKDTDAPIHQPAAMLVAAD